MRVKGQKSGVMRIFQALLVSYIITGILLLVLAVLLYKLNLDKGRQGLPEFMLSPHLPEDF